MGEVDVVDLAMLCEGWLWPDSVNPLVGWWRFDEVEGLTAADSSGHANLGTLMNGPIWTGDGALGFDGLDDYVEVADSGGWTLGAR